MSWSWLLFSFDGRIGRRTYWLRFVLPAFLLVLAAVVIMPPEPNVVVLTVTVLCMLAGIPVSVKRCHDRCRSGWFLLVGLIPVVGFLWLFVELGFMRGTVGPNRCGADPLAKPRRPIKYIIAEGLDLSFHSTKEEAESSLEAIDVRNGEYVGYDSEGRLLMISPRGQAAEITLAEQAPTHADQLLVLLIEWLARRDLKPDETDLAVVLTKCERETR